MARLTLLQGNAAAALEQVEPAVRYFSDEGAWQISYSIDQWQMSGYAVDTLIIQADANLISGETAAAQEALGKALTFAQVISSPAHILSVAAAYAELIEVAQPLLSTRLSARVATHSAGYALDKTRAQATLLRAASHAELKAEDFAEACLDGETFSIESVIALLSQDLS